LWHRGVGVPGRKAPKEMADPYFWPLETFLFPPDITLALSTYESVARSFLKHSILQRSTPKKIHGDSARHTSENLRGILPDEGMVELTAFIISLMNLGLL